MKWATYNVWNENKGRGNRTLQILDEVCRTGADIIGLQEVTPDFYEKHLLRQVDYPYCVYGKYLDEEEGLAILSRYPFDFSFFLGTSKEYAYAAALHIILRVQGRRISFLNLHLPWDSARRKEEQILAIDRYLHEQAALADYSVMLGDFNGSLNSSVHRYLLGEQTIDGMEAKPYWYELSSAYAVLHGIPLKPTLDFIHNPRWKRKNTTDIPYAADRIYVMDGIHSVVLKQVEQFGTEISPTTGLCASDHYGVMAYIEWKE